MNKFVQIISVCVTGAIIAIAPATQRAWSVDGNIVKNGTASEQTLGLCETEGFAVRIYNRDNQILMRGFNRKSAHIWINHAPISLTGDERSITYQNRMGELSTVVSIEPNTQRCTIQVEGQPIERGTLLVNGHDHAIVGNVLYAARIGLPPGSKVETQLMQLSNASTNTPTVIAEATMTPSGQQVPIPFALFYSPDEIDTAQRYGINAQIIVDNQRRWKNTADYPVITQGAPRNVSVVVNSVQLSDRTPSNNRLTQSIPDKIVTAVKAAFRQEIGDRPLQVGQYSRESWSDGCLGLGGPAEGCLATITEGWKVDLIDTTTNQRYTYRTDRTGNQVRREVDNSVL